MRRRLGERRLPVKPSNVVLPSNDINEFTKSRKVLNNADLFLLELKIVNSSTRNEIQSINS
ncbi:hypothetical protein HS7_01820 [Sulfolobales archaeon HS-7]|nr:hypothetical protein HS7_01820 [Sulfolobales archaeon HS-7]